MRKLVLYLIISVISCSVTAQEYKDITMNFSPQDYSLVSSNAGDYIESTSQVEVFLPDSTLPAIPFIPISVKIPNSKEYVGFTYTITQIHFADSVSLMNAPVFIPTNSILNEFDNLQSSYQNKNYPDNNVIFTGKSNYGVYSLLNFLISPWIYNAQSGILDLSTSLNLRIRLTQNSPITAPTSIDLSTLNNFTNALAINADEYVEMAVPTGNAIEGNSLYEYLIVTSDTLRDSFMPLVKWKKEKGVPAKIITISEIISTYSGTTLPLKIKNCLYDYYTNHGLKYVLLGGDDTIVPVRGCYVHCNSRIEENMPADIYYACFSGNFDWNANGNSQYGETTDNIDFAPSIYVSRAPVRSVQDVMVFVDKVLAYEKSPMVNGWNRNILMAGTKLWNNYIADPSISDAQAKSEKLYSTAIEPFWSGNRVRFYDTYTDFPDGSDHQLNSSNLQNELAKGYTFMDIATHGSSGSLAMEFGSYNTSNASSLVNPNPTIITTMACLTNAFDNLSDPCLSEAFIRNPNSNVVNYFGCSRYGWGWSGGNNSLGPSLQYEKCFYESLLSSEIEEKNWGVVTALAKTKMAPICNNYNSYRWLQLGLNPIGDPETPIFIDTPLEFNMASLELTTSSFSVNTGVSGCKISIMSSDDDGNSVYKIYNDTQYETETLGSHPLIVCISKQGYIPRLFKVSPTIFIQNETIEENIEYVGNQIKMGSNVTATIPTGDVIINNCNVTLKGGEVIINPNTYVNLGATLEVKN